MLCNIKVIFRQPVRILGGKEQQWKANPIKFITFDFHSWWRSWRQLFTSTIQTKAINGSLCNTYTWRHYASTRGNLSQRTDSDSDETTNQLRPIKYIKQSRQFLTIIARSPRAPVLRFIAWLATAFNASWVMSNFTFQRIHIRKLKHCLTVS